MQPYQEGGRVEKMANAVWLILLARISMVILGPAMFAGSIWLISSTISMQTNLALLQLNVSSLVHRADAIDKLIGNHYRAIDAERDLKLRDALLSDHEARIRVIERK